MADLLSTPHPPGRLKQLVAQAGASEQGPVVLPGCYDALGARLIELSGFPGVYMTGFGTSATLLGRPDVGLLGLAEMVDNARRIVDAVAVPVVADADTGYGNPINVVHTVRSYERAGVSAIHLEDQVTPKRCGHMEGKEVVAIEEFSAKIRAAVEARESTDFLLIARTDARAPHGIDEARRRADAAVEAGADVLFIEALQTPDEIQAIAEAYRGVPLIYNWVEGGKSPSLSYQDLTELGYAMVIMPITLLLAAVGGMQQALAQLVVDQTPVNVAATIPEFGDFTDLIGLAEITELQQRYV